MTTTSKNGAVVPVGSDPYALTADLLAMMNSAGLVFPVASAAVRDAIPSPNTGMVVSRLDRFGSLEYWTGTAWTPINPLPPFGHMGKTNGFTSGNANPVPMNAAQVLRGGMTFDDAADALVIPVAGTYELRAKAYFSGGGTGQCTVDLLVNTAGCGGAVRWNKTLTDEINNCGVTRVLAAGDKVSVTTTGPSNIYGADGYNGTWVEARYVGPAGTY